MDSSPDRHHRLMEWFEQAISLSGASRIAFVAQCNEQDRPLGAELEVLLAHDDSAAEGLPVQFPSLVASMPDRIGKYRVISVLGEGGFGLVYLAEQTEPMRRQVAIKVIRPGMTSSAVVSRFEFERETLARLNHPAIAHVYDAGETECGMPYVVLEHVPGVPITTYCESGSLGIDSTIRLFLEVCAGVEHAHRMGVLHRDLKPPNILVMDTPSGPSPKIIDFGVARLLGGEPRNLSMQTQAGQLVGTLYYMSPEQVSGDPAAIDTRSDVYALGVILYELLAGRRPFLLESTSLPDAASAIKDEEPVRLGCINESLRGDIDIIVSHALEKQAERRYQSVADFASDLRAYLEDQPIVARPANAAYRLHKFARRHRGLVAGLAATAVVLVAATIISASLAVTASSRGREAQRRSAHAEALNRFFVDMLAAANPAENLLGLERPANVRVVDILEYASTHIASAYESQPDAEADIRLALADVFSQLSMVSAAKNEVDKAIVLRAAVFGPEHPETHRARLREASLLLGLGESERAERLFHDLEVAFASALGSRSEESISAAAGISEVLFYQGRREEATESMREVMQRARRALGDHHPLTVDAEASLGLMLTGAQRAAEGEVLLRQALASRVAVHGSEHPRTWLTRSNLVAAVRAQPGRLPEAIAMQREILRAQQAYLPPGHGTLLFTQDNLAVLIAKSGKRDEAIEMLRKRLELSSQDPQAYLAMGNLAGMLHAADSLDEALVWASRAAETLAERLDAPESTQYFSAMRIARIAADLGRHELSAESYGEAVRIGTGLFSRDHARITDARLGRAENLRALNRLDEAEQELRRCEAIGDGLGPALRKRLDRERALLAASRAAAGLPPSHGVPDRNQN